MMFIAQPKPRQLKVDEAVRQALAEAGITQMNADDYSRLVDSVAKRAYREAHKPEGPSREQRRRLKQIADGKLKIV